MTALRTPARLTCAAHQSSPNPLLQQGTRTEACPIGLVHDFLCLQAKARCSRIHEFERPHGMPQSEATYRVDLLRRPYSLLHEPDGFDHEDVQKPVNGESG